MQTMHTMLKPENEVWACVFAFHTRCSIWLRAVMYICVAQCKMHYSCNALQCISMCNFQICNCIQMHYKMNCMFLECITMPPKRENGRQAREMGRRWLNKSLSYFKHLSLEWRVWLELLRQKRSLSTSSLSKCFSVFLMQSWASWK